MTSVTLTGWGSPPLKTQSASARASWLHSRRGFVSQDYHKGPRDPAGLHHLAANIDLSVSASPQKQASGCLTLHLQNGSKNQRDPRASHLHPRWICSTLSTCPHYTPFSQCPWDFWCQTLGLSCCSSTLVKALKKQALGCKP